MDISTVLKLGIKRFKGAVREEIYLKLNHDITKPETIRGVVNERCNFKCPYCYCWQRSEYPEISIAQWQLALLSLKQYIGNYVIQFSGGEPFVKKGFLELLKFCHDNEIDWGVITNGSLFNQRTVDIVVDAKPLNIDISIDSNETAINDLVRGVKNSVNIVSNSIDKLCKTRLRRDAKFLLRIKPTVTLQNYRSLPQLVEWAIGLGVDTVDFAPVRPIPFWNKETYSKLWLNLSDVHELENTVETLVEMKMNGYPIETSVEKIRSFVDHFLQKHVSHGAVPCRVGLRDYHINPNGDVKVCWEYPAIGNVIKQSAKELWESQEARQIRDQTVECDKFKTLVCANSCLSHRTLKQELERACQFIKIGGT